MLILFMIHITYEQLNMLGTQTSYPVQNRVTGKCTVFSSTLTKTRDMDNFQKL